MTNILLNVLTFLDADLMFGSLLDAVIPVGAFVTESLKEIKLGSDDGDDEDEDEDDGDDDDSDEEDGDDESDDDESDDDDDDDSDDEAHAEGEVG